MFNSKSKSPVTSSFKDFRIHKAKSFSMNENVEDLKI